MFRHIVLLRWVDDATDEQKADVEAGLRELPGIIPEIRSYVMGADAGINPESYSFGVVADFDSAEDYVVYRDHPEHRKVIAERIAPILAERAAIQCAV